MSTKPKYHHYIVYGQWQDQREEISTASITTAYAIYNAFKRLNADYVGIDASIDANDQYIDPHYAFYERADIEYIKGLAE